jgi:ATP-dependent protease ClpP protease subunit
MTKRQLPALTASQPKAEVRFDFHPQARAKWDRGLRAAAGAGGRATVEILDPIGIDFWTGEGVTARSVRADLARIGEVPVTVLINSPGGDFFEGLAIYNLLREHPAEVTVQILGIAASAASIIAMAGDTIQIAKAGMIFIHNTQWCACGDRHVMQQAFEEMEGFDEIGAQLYVDRTGADLAQVHQWMDKETFFSGEASVSEGFADELLPGDTQRSATAAAETSPAYRLEALLARYDIPRAERRKAMREFIDATPSAGLSGTPSAADLDEGLAHLRAARMRLGLAAT